MRARTSVFIATSLDGFIARRDGSIDWLLAGESSGEDFGYQAFADSIDGIVMGRHTYELALTFDPWPYAGKRLVVLSTGAPRIPEALADSVTLMQGAPEQVIERLSRDGARHLYIDGGVTIQRFLAAKCVDELTITRIPVLIGSGLPLFADLPGDVRLEHLATRAYANGYVQSRYRVIQTT